MDTRNPPYLLCVLCGLLCLPYGALGGTVYFNDFENGVTGAYVRAGIDASWSKTSTDVTPTGARHFLGQFNNETISLTLSNLTHRGNIGLAFDLFVIRTWDGNGGPYPGPDIWSCAVLGAGTLIDTTFSNFRYSPWQAYPGTYPKGHYPKKAGATEVGTLGYDFWHYGEHMVNIDSVYHMDFTIRTSTPSLQFAFKASGLQSLPDESWGLDNVRVHTDVAFGIRQVTDHRGGHGPGGGLTEHHQPVMNPAGKDFTFFSNGSTCSTRTEWFRKAFTYRIDSNSFCESAIISNDCWSLANIQANSSADGSPPAWEASCGNPSTCVPVGLGPETNCASTGKALVSSEVRQVKTIIRDDGYSAIGEARLWQRTSLDGTHTVFVSNRELTGTPITSNRYGIFIADATGRIARLTAASIPVEREFPAFSMDDGGAQLVFASDADLTGHNKNNNFEIFCLDLRSGAATQITDTASTIVNARPILSGNGKKIAFLSNGNLDGFNPGRLQQLWVYHFDSDRNYVFPFIQVTALTSVQTASNGRKHWMDWYSMDRTGAQLVFCSNADPVGQNGGHDYELFLATFEWSHEADASVSGIDADLRTWKDTKGRMIEASLVESSDSIVKLKKRDGNVYTVQLVQLSDADRAFIKERLAKER